MQAPTAPAYIYRATVTKVIDGDTWICSIDLGLFVSIAVHVRLHGADAPEVSKPWEHADPASPGYQAAEFAHNALSGVPVLLSTYKDERSFERWVCDMWIDGRSFAETMIAEGHAVPLEIR